MSDYKISLVALSAAFSAFAFSAQAQQSTKVEPLVVTASRAGPVPADRSVRANGRGGSPAGARRPRRPHWTRVRDTGREGVRP